MKIVQKQDLFNLLVAVLVVLMLLSLGILRADAGDTTTHYRRIDGHGVGHMTTKDCLREDDWGHIRYVYHGDGEPGTRGDRVVIHCLAH